MVNRISDVAEVLVKELRAELFENDDDTHEFNILICRYFIDISADDSEPLTIIEAL